MNIKPITFNDLVEIKNLQPEDWPDIIPDIEMYIRYSFCYPIKITMDNKIVGIGASIIFEKTGWMAHIIVHPDYRNKGIGLAMVNELLNQHKSQFVTTSLLIASESGHPVYLNAGFRDVGEYVYLNRENRCSGYSVSDNITPFQADYITQILKLDKHISGENREDLLTDYLHNSIVYLNKDTVEGYYMPGFKEGLIYADNETAGIELMKIKYSTIDKAVLPSENYPAISFLKNNGFVETQLKGTRMMLGKTIDWHPEKVYSRIGGNLG
jgi:GNAT superfamily N-acetyltransferase